jgi:hypothetical protein
MHPEERDAIKSELLPDKPTDVACFSHYDDQLKERRWKIFKISLPFVGIGLFLVETAWGFLDLKPNIIASCALWVAALICFLVPFWMWVRWKPWSKLVVAIGVPILLAGIFWKPVVVEYRNQHAKPTWVVPVTSFAWRIMPFDPPYAIGTVIAGIPFEKWTLDARLYLHVAHARVKNLDFTIALINTSGQILGIPAVAQLTEFPSMTIVPVTSGPYIPGSMTFNGNTVALGSKDPSGEFRVIANAWRIHCTELLENTTPEFVLMVRRPYRTKMIEGFIVQGSYSHDAGDETKTSKFIGITMFDDLGNPRQPTPQEIERITNYGRTKVGVSNSQVHPN